MTSNDEVALTDTERQTLEAYLLGGGLRGQSLPEATIAATEAILASRYDQWEWGYGERVRRLESELEAMEAKLAAARAALAAVRDVRQAQIEKDGR